METELKNLNQNTPNNTSNSSQQINNDDQPLLKSPPSSSSDQGPTQNQEKQLLTSEEIKEIEKKFGAYVRHDVYGPMGLGDIPLSEKLMLCLAMLTLVPLRVVLGMTILVLYYLICKICTAFSRPGQGEQEQEQEDYAHLGGFRRFIIVRTGRFLSRALLFTLGFYWISKSSKVSLLHQNTHDECDIRDLLENSESPGVIISNHISYLDILYHMSSSFPSFVAKRSVGKLPLVGLISKCLGCVYVQREDKSSDFKGVSGIVTDRIKEAHANSDAPLMLIFPEGTTTNGNYLLPFKTGAFIAGAPVLPVVLRYPYCRFSPAWDSISGVRHVILLLCQFVNHMEVMSLPIYIPSKEEKDDPKLYANNVRKLMANEGNLIMSDVGLPEKRIYHAALNGNYSLRSALHQKND